MSPGRQRLLAATLLPPGREWYVSTLATYLSVTPSTLQRDLTRLSASGILLRRREGNRVYFKADPECPILPELRQMLVKTVGLVDQMREALAPFSSSIRCAFVHGSVARAEEASESDVDVVAIGGVRLLELALPLRSLREQLSREVNVTVYKPEEFAKKAKSGHHFIHELMVRKKLFLVGSDDDLGKIVGGETRRR